MKQRPVNVGPSSNKPLVCIATCSHLCQYKPFAVDADAAFINLAYTNLCPKQRKEEANEAI